MRKTDCTAINRVTLEVRIDEVQREGEGREGTWAPSSPVGVDRTIAPSLTEPLEEKDSGRRRRMGRRVKEGNSRKEGGGGKETEAEVWLCLRIANSVWWYLTLMLYDQYASRHAQLSRSNILSPISLIPHFLVIRQCMPDSILPYAPFVNFLPFDNYCDYFIYIKKFVRMFWWSSLVLCGHKL